MISRQSQGSEAALWSSQEAQTPQEEGQAAGQPQHGLGREQSPTAELKWILGLWVGRAAQVRLVRAIRVSDECSQQSLFLPGQHKDFLFLRQGGFRIPGPYCPSLNLEGVCGGCKSLEVPHLCCQETAQLCLPCSPSFLHTTRVLCHRWHSQPVQSLSAAEWSSPWRHEGQE